MNNHYDDERVTAYVFDELDPEEKAQFERELEQSPPLAKLVTETRETVNVLENDLRSEPGSAGLSSPQRESVHKAIHEKTGSVESRSRSPLAQWLIPLVGVAAVVLVASAFWWRASLRSEVAQTSQQDDARSASVQSNLEHHFAEAPVSTSSEPAADSSEVAAVEETSGPHPFATPDHSVQPPTNAPSPTSQPSSSVATSPAPTSPAPASGIKRGLAHGQAVGGGVEFDRAKDKYDFKTKLEASRAPVLGLASSGGENSKEGREADDGLGPGQGGDKYDLITDNPFIRVQDQPLSTFSIDVDTASYSKVRMYLLQHGQLPRPDAVRIEELVNYFPYDYEAPPMDAKDPFVAHMAIADCPWNSEHRLARIAIKGKEFADEDRPASNLVFLLDVSGSMNQPNKLPLLKRGMKMLVDRLGENDRVAIVVYAGAAGLVLDSTTGDQKSTILGSLERLQAGGSTNGGAGIQLAYQTAMDHFIPGGTNRVILCTDGDFNVGTTGTDSLVRMAEENAKANVFLTVLGFGMGNHNDSMLEQVSNKGNGNYAFVDTDAEAHKVLVEQMQGTLVTIAKDVKIQIEFNPAQVAGYRLIGYENRILAAEDFNDDTKDAGEIGSGHTVTALYELVPADKGDEDETLQKRPPVDELRYQQPAELTDKAQSEEALVLKLRYKEPEEDTSKLLTQPVKDAGQRFGDMDSDFQFAAAVASFGMLLRDSPHKGDSNWNAVLEIASGASEEDASGYRAEFLEMVEKAREIAR